MANPVNSDTSAPQNHEPIPRQRSSSIPLTIQEKIQLTNFDSVNNDKKPAVYCELKWRQIQQMQRSFSEENKASMAYRKQKFLEDCVAVQAKNEGHQQTLTNFLDGTYRP